VLQRPVRFQSHEWFRMTGFQMTGLMSTPPWRSSFDCEGTGGTPSRTMPCRESSICFASTDPFHHLLDVTVVNRL
jgi:hypothetical protein